MQRGRRSQRAGGALTKTCFRKIQAPIFGVLWIYQPINGRVVMVHILIILLGDNAARDH